jgi:glycosyltransferase involved in cell wall biosynthesis
VYYAGGGLSPQSCAQFDYVQALAPYYVERAEKAGVDTRTWFMIPNFVNCALFQPGDERDLKAQLGIPPGAFVVLSVGAIQSYYKRMDWLVYEFREFAEKSGSAHLVLVGSREKDTARIEALARSLLGNRVTVLTDIPHNQLPSIFRMADVFVLCSTSEVFGIAFIEAMATGLAVIGHCAPVTKWILGEGGITVDMTKRGELRAALECVESDSTLRKSLGKLCRERAVREFSKDKQVSALVEMYQRIYLETH